MRTGKEGRTEDLLLLSPGAVAVGLLLDVAAAVVVVDVVDVVAEGGGRLSFDMNSWTGGLCYLLWWWWWRWTL